MALRGKKPEVVKTRFKALIYGKPKVGKTYASLHFPKPYVIDTEDGSKEKQYVDILNKEGGAKFRCFEFDEMLKEVRALATEKHDYKTLIIDSLTQIVEPLIDQCEIKYGSKYGKHIYESNKYLKRLANLLIRLDMNVIIIAHEKAQYDDKMVIVDELPEVYKKAPYIFDLILQIKMDDKRRKALVRGSRHENLQKGEEFEWTYQEIANRYGIDNIEAEVKSLNFATDDQIKILQHLFETLNISEDVIKKGLQKKDAQALSDLPEDAAAQWIEHLEAKLKPEIKEYDLC